MLVHEGQYTCVVTNSAGEDKRDFHVTIQGTFAEIGTLIPQKFEYWIQLLTYEQLCNEDG